MIRLLFKLGVAVVIAGTATSMLDINTGVQALDTLLEAVDVWQLLDWLDV